MQDLLFDNRAPGAMPNAVRATQLGSLCRFAHTMGDLYEIVNVALEEGVDIDLPQLGAPLTEAEARVRRGDS